MSYAVTPLDGRYKRLVKALKRIVSEFGLMKYRVRIMVAWVEMLMRIGVITLDPQLLAPLKEVAKNFRKKHFKRIKEIEATSDHDVKAVEYWLRELCDEALWPWLHFACTSEDVNNVAYAFMLRDGRDVVQEVLAEILSDLELKAKQMKALSMLGRTHGQAATPTTMGKEMAVFHRRLTKLSQRLAEVPIAAKFNGATGNFAAHCVAYPYVNWIKVSRDLITELGFEWNPLTTQIECHDMQAAMMNEINQICVALDDLCSDGWLYISRDYFSQKVVKNEVGSSTMPQKVNPIRLENGRGNFWIAMGVARVLADKLPKSTEQRDLSDSTLQRAFGEVFGHFLVGLSNTLGGLRRMEVRPEVLQAALDANPAVLTEAVQTVMRKHGHADAYEQLKEFARGKQLTLHEIREFIRGRAIPDEDKNRLLELEPAAYIGLSVELVDQFVA